MPKEWTVFHLPSTPGPGRGLRTACRRRATASRSPPASNDPSWSVTTSVSRMRIEDVTADLAARPAAAAGGVLWALPLPGAVANSQRITRFAAARSIVSSSPKCRTSAVFQLPSPAVLPGGPIFFLDNGTLPGRMAPIAWPTSLSLAEHLCSCGALSWEYGLDCQQ
jgi:hypothetical protein